MMNNQITIQKPDHKTIELTNLMKDKMNNDLKAKYSKILEEEYAVSRNNDSSKFNRKIKKLLFLAIATLILILGFTSYISSSATLHPEKVDAKQMAFQYMAENKIEYYNTTRSAALENALIKSNAYSAFSNNDFENANKLFQNLKDKNAEDLFFNGLSSLETQDYTNATQLFNESLSKLKPGDAYFHEAKLYLVISFILNDQISLANQMFQGLDNRSWEFSQLQHIMG